MPEESTIQMTRSWAMPSKHTFRIHPIRQFVEKAIDGCDVIIDPFCGESEYATVSNDLNPDIPATYHMDALDFLKTLDDASADIILYDPPYSPRQIAECYRSVGLDTDGGRKTRSSFYSNIKIEMARVIKTGGRALTCGWNTNGVGKTRGFVIESILVVAHGGAHNDTLVTLERKVR